MRKTFIKTDGKGLWSRAVRKVHIYGVDLVTSLLTDDKKFRSYEVQVRFDTDTWNVKKLGLIYTDDAFLAGMKKLLVRMGLSKDTRSRACRVIIMCPWSSLNTGRMP